MRLASPNHSPVSPGNDSTSASVDGSVGSTGTAFSTEQVDRGTPASSELGSTITIGGSSDRGDCRIVQNHSKAISHFHG